MKTIIIPTNTKLLAKGFIFFFFAFLCATQTFAQETNEQQQDSTQTQTGFNLGEIRLKQPGSIVSKYTYDPILDRYIYTETVGEFDIRYPLILTPEQYQDLILKEQMKGYFKEKLDAISGQKEGTEEAQRNLLPEFYINSDFFESIFGGNTIEVIPQGSVAMDLGVRFQKNDNPSLSPRNRRNLAFDFDQRISLSLLGKVGERLKVTANYDTESTFDFQNLIKLEFTPTEDDIIRKIEVGNVSMPLNSSLLTGAQSLFGVKTQLQFGKTTITGVFSEQRSQTRSVTAQGGGTVEEFELFALDYDEDRHFFLSQYFRDQYDTAINTYPYINTQVQITRIEVWVTNRSAQTNNVRNIVAIQDIGESDPARVGLNPLPGGFFNVASTTALPDNGNNDLDPTQIGVAGASILTEDIRDIATVNSGFGVSAPNVNEGFDYAILESARKLEPTEYQLNTQLGYISLNQKLSNDEVLGVAFQYTVGGQVYQVGEFANDGVNATDVTDDGSGNLTLDNNNLVVKMLKSSITNVSQPVWDLMMKNIYSTGAFQLSPDDFRFNILYSDPSPINYISPIDLATWPTGLEEQILLSVFNLDKLNIYNDPQNGGDGFFDYLPGITVDQQYGRIIFTSVEPFGEFLFNRLEFNASEDYDVPASYNANQTRYVYRDMYRLTKAAALESAEQNKFQLKGRYKSSGGDGIPIGAFNVPRGSVRVTAGGRLLQEGVDYTVNYQIGRVQILDESLKASNVPIEVSVENNSVFGQQTRRFTGIDVEHKINENFLVGATFLNLNERPITQKANYGAEPVNNTLLGFRTNFSTEVPFLTRMVNKLPNIDTDVPSNVSVRGEFAYLLAGSPKNADFDGEATAYLDDFEGAQSTIDMRGALAWSLASVPSFGEVTTGTPNNNQLEDGFRRARLAWYSIDPIFYSTQRPSGVSDDDLSSSETRRIFISEIFPEVDIVQGQSTVQNTLDMAYYPEERGPYNNNPTFATDPTNQNWGGIMRSITSTNFEQANVEYVQFWLLDPYYSDGNVTSPGGQLVFNLGNMTEDILRDGRKQYENGLPGVGSNVITETTSWSRVPSAQSLVYAFDADEANRNLQDLGFDGLSDADEASIYTNGPADDPAQDNYQYYLAADGDLLTRYKRYNGTDGNSPVNVGDTNRGSTTLPDVEDINRDQSMNTIDNYFQFTVPIQPNASINDQFITDIRLVNNISLSNGNTIDARWIQYKIPITAFTSPQDGSLITTDDLRSIRFMRMYMTGFNEQTVLRFGTLDLVRGDWRRYTQSLQPTVDNNPDDDGTFVDVNTVNIQENENRTPIPYVLPPGVRREQLNNNNTIIDQNEQSLAFTVCDLQPEDSRGVFKNIDIDMRQYKRLKMFIHAESFKETPVLDLDLVGFIRIGTDFSDNFYQIEIPLNITPPLTTSREGIWPADNEIDLPLDLLTQIKSIGISNGTLTNPEPVYYDEDLNEVPEFAPRESGRLRVGIKGNPTLGNIRSLMVGIKNATTKVVCGEVWFNELRLAELETKGGWAAIAAVDANLADFANVSATGRMSTIGFGGIDQTPNERSREDTKQYDVVTNVNIGQLFPQKWGIQIPFNYAISEEIITPEYDPFYQDIRLQDRLDAESDATNRDRIENQAIDYTKRKSINFIGVKKNRTAEQKPHFYDVENFDFSYSYNQLDHHDYEIEMLKDQNVRVTANYNYSFQPKSIEPFKNMKFLSRSSYWAWLKDFNFNLLPSNISLTSNINRNFNQQRFREVYLDGVDASEQLALPELQQRNFLFDWAYNINHNLTKSLRFNFGASNNNIVKNYFNEDGTVNSDLGIWDGFWDIGDPNQHSTQLGVNYDLPINKIPIFSFINASYNYTANFNWQRGSDALRDVVGSDGSRLGIVNTIQNANTHTINSTLSMDKLYKYIGFVRKKPGSRTTTGNRVNPRGNRVPLGGSANDKAKDDKAGDNKAGNDKKKKTKVIKNNFGTKAWNTMVDVLGSVKRIGINYSENNGTVLPGYVPSVGFIGTLKPSVGFVFGSQSDIRFEAAKQGWLTTFPEFNQQFTQVHNTLLDVTAAIEPMKDLKIDLNANRNYSENFSEQFLVSDVGNDGTLDYQSLTPNTFGNFGISTILIKTAFSKSDETSSEPFEQFQENRLEIARRLAIQRGNDPNVVDADGFPVGYGKTNQAVLLPAFLAAYTGQDAQDVKLGAFRDVPIPNWTLKYTGLMRLKWFKKNFKRFSLTHGYRASYTVNSFRTNLDFDAAAPDEVDQAGNFKNETLFSNINLVEQFNPLIKFDMEMNNSINIVAEMRKDRALSLSFDNNLLTETKGNEFILGLGYRIKDLKMNTRIGGKKTTLSGDLNLKADLSLRDNITIIRSLDILNNQVTAGQTLWSLKFTADYAMSRNLTALFFYDHTFSEFAISTAFPQTTIRTGFTLRYNFGN